MFSFHQNNLKVEAKARISKPMMTWKNYWMNFSQLILHLKINIPLLISMSTRVVWMQVTISNRVDTRIRITNKGLQKLFRSLDKGKINWSWNKLETILSFTMITNSKEHSIFSLLNIKNIKKILVAFKVFKKKLKDRKSKNYLLKNASTSSTISKIK